MQDNSRPPPWTNNLGLVQLDDRVWRVRLGAVCSDGANLEHLAAAYIQGDDDVSQRSDDSLPTPIEVAQTLEMVVFIIGIHRRSLPCSRSLPGGSPTFAARTSGRSMGTR